MAENGPDEQQHSHQQRDLVPHQLEHRKGGLPVNSKENVSAK